ncbi:TIGR00725 family protein [Fodinibius halophilus]|uniref:TIGR00725 family protein n=1 Tax=Fodinibius halophilus TaxID=1736908 RepID=A0A6M1T795_9BACT|nr:TIGR00725 family protein [Fodinibius halophilus]NGP88533.1 TIGR00725 family protein [Fodinibius halophilus]
MANTIIGVMGPGEGATQQNISDATELGKLIAEKEWVLLTGGRNVGVMNAASKGAQQAGGLIVGILPSENRDNSSPYVDIPICTGMGGARNNINVLSSDVVVACGMGAGTTTEIMLAIKAQKPLLLLNAKQSLMEYLEVLPYPSPKQATSPAQLISFITPIL